MNLNGKAVIVDEDWRKASNYVAKSYKPAFVDETTRQTQLDDVVMQVKCKQLSDMYNACNPPKKIDMLVTDLIEFVDRPGRALFGVEVFITGEYKKYNSNGGYVRGATQFTDTDASEEDTDVQFRMTPQAFSHFTFEKSRGQLIVVDIQVNALTHTHTHTHTHTRARRSSPTTIH